MYIDAFKRLLFERLNCLKRMCVCQRQGSSFTMSKAAVKKLHWRSKVLETFVPLLGSSGDLGVAVGGGADYGEFPFVTSAPGGGLTVGNVILEIGGTPVLGMTLGDVRGVLNSCAHPVRVKTVSPGSTLCRDLRLYLSKCFTPGSMDSQLQQVIRENLYLRAVPCTTRPPRDGEISGVDYNFVSIEEFFALEESGALLESGKFKGNYYGTPRPVHIGPESPPITYQEHRNLLRKFRTRSKSLSNLEKAADEGDDSEEDCGLAGRCPSDRLLRGSAGIRGAPPAPLSSPRGSSGGDGCAMENGGSSSSRLQAVMSENWEVAFSETGEPYYVDHHSKTTSWQDPRAQRRESVDTNELAGFTEQPAELRGFSVHTRLSKGSRGFGFNIVGGSRPREFLQVYSVTPEGPSALNTADILVYINNTCVLGVSHKEVVEMLQLVPVGHNVDVVVRRGYPMLYNPDGCPKQPPPRLPDSRDPLLPPTTTQPQPLHQRLPALLPAPSPYTSAQHLNLNGVYQGGYLGLGVGSGLDANGNAPLLAPRLPAPSSRRSSASLAPSTAPSRPPRSLRGLPRLQPLDNSLGCQSDSEVVSALGSHRASMIRNHNNNTLSAPHHAQRYGNCKSSESDLSTCTLPVSRLPVPQSPQRPSSSPRGPRGAYSRLIRPQTSLLRPPPTPDSPQNSFNGYHGNTSGSASPSSMSSPGAMSLGSGGGGGGGGELVPVALAQNEGGRGLGFGVTAGGQGGQLAVVKRVWDRRQCSSLQPGDVIVKINGADIQSLSFAQVQKVLQEHTKLGEVVLLVYRGGTYHPSISPNSIRRLPPPLLRPPPPPAASDNPSPPARTQPLSRTSVTSASSATPPPHAPGHTPRRGHSSLVQSTSFLESVPVTLTMEPRDWQSVGLEDEVERGTAPPAAGQEGVGRARLPKGFEVELKRKAGEGFGFVIASQDVENGKATSLLPHRFVTVRRGSPAARSGQIRPGDRLEAVGGRSVLNLPHRELAHILRRAGNTLRLTIVPRPSTYSSSLSESTDYDPNHRIRKGHRSRPKHDSRYYSVDLDRGPTGFGFSLRGGSEYNMGLYVLGLMEGGPASRSHKIQVSDQLVEINGDSTVGMTHSQAVEQIRRGGHRIHLVLKKGNGYVPDYGRERRVTSPPRPQPPQEQGLAAVGPTHRRSHQAKTKRRGRSSQGQGKRREGGSRRRGGRRDSGKEAGSRRESPTSESEEENVSRGQRAERTRDKVRSQSLPREALRNLRKEDTEQEADEEEEEEEERGRKESRKTDRKRKSKSEDRVGKIESEKKREDEEDEVEEVMEKEQPDAILPIPFQRLPKPKLDWEERKEDLNEEQSEWETRRERLWEYEMMRGSDGERGEERAMDRDRLRREEDETSEWEERSQPGLVSRGPVSPGPVLSPRPQRDHLSFLTSTQLESAESESGDSLSDGSVSAASVSGLSLAPAGGARLLPGPWLPPSSPSMAQLRQERRLAGGGRGAVS
ncbi:membrane-associated guanylate kinase, WW and PDZ domain-containing protein 3 isoform X4 [Hypomesus transpacificus]|uniref:membrane-associated guanylate kinase, WW and PDZ domain-containing protein 3 isoform X4 n=1 Tax=Hypomesus transpacificus TaxID=137520 RepID=UPI001F07E555|nr:membrane-associated guanylate kinase, WW and PDZ domain-containing protein 3 isoform X4 [Hypomesus transpacificus]